MKSYQLMKYHNEQLGSLALPVPAASDEQHQAYFQDLATTWRAFQQGEPNPFTGLYGELLGAHTYCLGELYRIVWRGWESIKAGLGSLCPESPAELFELLVAPDPSRHQPLAQAAADLLCQNAPNLHGIKVDLLVTAEARALLEAVLLLVKRATKGKGFSGIDDLKLALKNYERARRQWIRQEGKTLNNPKALGAHC